MGATLTAMSVQDPLMAAWPDAPQWPARRLWWRAAARRFAYVIFIVACLAIFVACCGYVIDHLPQPGP